MSPTAKSLTAAAAILAATGAILVGAVMRDRVDVGGLNAIDPNPPSGLMASRDNRDTREVPEGDYFYEITNLLKQRYVEKVGDEQKLALGAIRGMIASLNDLDSTYLEKDEYAIHTKMRRGQFEGIGAQLELVETDADPQTKPAPTAPAEGEEENILGPLRIPKVMVVTVVPGGPADKAGVRVGDYVEYIGDHWVPNIETVKDYRKLTDEFNKGKVTWDQLSKVRVELTNRMKKILQPPKAREKLLAGQTGSIQITWRRGKTSLPTNIALAPSRLAEFSDVDNVIQLRFVPGVEKELKQAIEGKTEITIDLRNNANGLPTAMRACLEVLAPKGTYGAITVSKRETALEVKEGNAKPPQITLLVDKSTRGAAEIFADVLAQAGVAKVTGGPTAGHPVLVEDYPLPDGSGYTLAVGSYKGGAK